MGQKQSLKRTHGLAVLRGGGDIATGVAQKLWRSGFGVVILESRAPTTIRTTVSLSTAVWRGRFCVEDVTACKVETLEECAHAMQNGEIPLFCDPECDRLESLQPDYLVDAMIAKENRGTYKGMAPVVIGLGPGFAAPEQVDAAIETMRGHYLGQMILHGEPRPNTGTPGELGGETFRRVVHAPAEGICEPLRVIGDRVQKEEPILKIGDTVVPSPLEGTLRGMLWEGLYAHKGLKCADVDPRPADQVDVYTISDKARCIGGSVLEACLYGREQSKQRK